MSEPQWHRSPWDLSCTKNVRNMIGTICFVIVIFLYTKSIVQNTYQILFNSTTIELVAKSDLAGSRVHANVFSQLDPDAGPRKKAPLHSNIRNDTSIQSVIDADSGTSEQKGKPAMKNSANRDLTFYILPSPDIVTTLQNVINRTKSDLLAMASEYYDNVLNEESAEMWLHRGFERLPARITENPKEADVYIVVGYCHLFSGLISREKQRSRNQKQRQLYRKRRDRNVATPFSLQSQSWAEIARSLYQNVVVDATKPHLILIPTWNPEVSRRIGLHSIVSALQLHGIADSNLWSVGFERSQKWQPIPLVSHILPIPYVVNHKGRQNQSREVAVAKSTNTTRKENSVFYVGDPRRNANEWAGCSRSNIIHALNKQRASEYADVSIYLRLVDKKNRLNQTLYRRLVRSSEYCLVLCGDTPSSRTLTEAIVEGCIPVRVGSRLRGLCDPPCHEGFGWTITGPNNPHLPFEDRIPWDNFPEIDEGALFHIPNGASAVKYTSNKSLSGLKNMFQTYGTVEKEKLRAVMDEVRPGFIYGYGDPVLSQDMGDAALYIWNSFLAALRKR